MKKHGHAKTEVKSFFRCSFLNILGRTPTTCASWVTLKNPKINSKFYSKLKQSYSKIFVLKSLLISSNFAKSFICKISATE